MNLLKLEVLVLSDAPCVVFMFTVRVSTKEQCLFLDDGGPFVGQLLSKGLGWPFMGRL